MFCRFVGNRAGKLHLQDAEGEPAFAARQPPPRASRASSIVRVVVRKSRRVNLSVRPDRCRDDVTRPSARRSYKTGPDGSLVGRFAGRKRYSPWCSATSRRREGKPEKKQTVPSSAGARACLAVMRAGTDTLASRYMPPQKRGSGQSKRLTLEELSANFHLPINDVARKVR